MVYLDLGELPGQPTLKRLISDRRASPACFRPQDHLAGGHEPLDEAIRDRVAAQTGIRPRGPIRVLTQLRYFGIYFSPLNLFYCFDEAGQRVEAILAEVSNTPWREQHMYVLWEGNRLGRGRPLRFRHPKSFHVSPFMGMDATYRWRLTEPSDRLAVRIRSQRDSTRLFDASMSLARRPLNRSQLTRMLIRYPVMTAQIVGAIYWQALRLWWKKCPFYTHPAKLNAPHRMPA